MAIRADESAVLTKLGKLEIASEHLKVSFEEVAQSAVAKRVPGFTRAVKKEELKRQIRSGFQKPGHGSTQALGNRHGADCRCGVDHL